MPPRLPAKLTVGTGVATHSRTRGDGFPRQLGSVERAEPHSVTSTRKLNHLGGPATDAGSAPWAAVPMRGRTAVNVLPTPGVLTA